MHSRYIEAAVGGVLVGCLYLPNGNPAPGPKFDYKLRWFERLTAHAAELLAQRRAGRAGRRLQRHADRPRRLQAGALGRRRPVPAGGARGVPPAASRRAGPTRCGTLHPDERIYTFWDYFRNAYGRDAGLRIDHLLLSPAVAGASTAAGVDRDVRGLGEGERPRADLDRAGASGGGATRASKELRMPRADPFDLQRFVTAQGSVFETALAELRRVASGATGCGSFSRRLRGLGRSPTAHILRHRVAASEARAYLAIRCSGRA